MFPATTPLPSDSAPLSALLAQLGALAPEHTVLREQLLHKLSCMTWEGGRTALHVVTEAGRMELIPLLIERMESFLVHDEKGNYPLDLVPAERLEATARVFLNAARRVNEHAGLHLGLYLLDTAMLTHQRERARALIRAGVPVNEACWKGYTPLVLAVSQGDAEMLHSMLSEGSLSQEILSPPGEEWMPLHHAAIGGKEDCAAILLEHGQDVNATVCGGISALHMAAQHGQADMIDFLLSHGAEREARDEQGRSALHYAAHYGQEAALLRLLAAGADLEAQTIYGNLPLDMCEQGEHVACAVLLVEEAFRRKRRPH